MTYPSSISTMEWPSDHARIPDVKPGSQGLGWFLRRTRSPATLARFYEAGLGLVRLRGWDTPNTAGEMLWCGDVGVVELNRLDVTTSFNPEESPCLPVFGSLDVEASVERALAAGAIATAGAFDGHPGIHGFKDPDGFFFGIEAISPEITRYQSATDRTWPSGVANLLGGISIDGPIQCLSKVIHKSIKPVEELAFLAALGFPVVSHNAISLGGVTEIVMEQDLRTTLPEPLANREMAHDTWVARVYGIENYRSALSSRDGKLLSTHEFPGGVLDYAFSPSNILIGWQERKSYDPDIPTTQMIEDLAARTHWINRSGVKAD